MAQVIAGVNIPPTKAVEGIGDLIRTFATSSHGGIATEPHNPGPNAWVTASRTDVRISLHAR
jgi:hypothetical protein